MITWIAIRPDKTTIEETKDRLHRQCVINLLEFLKKENIICTKFPQAVELGYDIIRVE